MRQDSIQLEYQRSLELTWHTTLQPHQQEMFLLGMISVCVTLNDQRLLAVWLPRCQGILNQTALEEILLQTLLFAGFPKTIEAFRTLRQHFPNAPLSSPHQDRRGQGLDTSRKVYGQHHQRLLEVMDSLHPDLTRWMIEDGYGRVLSRPGLDLQQREIAVLAVLMVTGMSQQFRAHFRGALNAGVQLVDILWYTNTFRCILAPDLHQTFKNMQDRALAEMPLSD